MYIRLKALRAEHNLYQKDLGEILGLSQSVVSRMEKTHAELDDVLYERLVKKYGEKEVARFIGEPPTKNIQGTPRRKDPAPIPDELTLEQALAMQAQTIKLLTETNQIQQRTIDTQAALIAWLKEKVKE